MTKQWLLGIFPALLLFLAFLGLNILPLTLVLAIGGALFFLLHQRGLLQRHDLHGAKKEGGVTFDDVGGNERVKNELREALDFLKHKDLVKRYGIRPIKGILLTGPPGTGKTLLAKAAANYTDSAFLSVSGSEFTEMYVGVGAQRIRKLFKEARQQAERDNRGSAIIFIDEIDVLGGRRDGQQHREYDQTLNQLLTEMDGIGSAQGPQVLVIAATNRKDMLDEALLRPGRFDRQIEVDLPEKKARLQILRLHSRNKPFAPDVELEKIADETFGFSGAQLESLLNEAAIYAMRDEQEKIGQRHLAQGLEKVMLGEKTDRVASREEKERVAIHELGHALVAESLRPQSVAQVTLSPRGQALGYVRHHPGQDKYLYTKDYLEEEIMICLAGAAAEEIFLGSRSTGAKNDYEQAIRTVHTMLECGLSRLGIVQLENLSKQAIHEETQFILEQLYQRTAHLLKDKSDLFHKLLQELLREESLSGEQFRALLAFNSPGEGKSAAQAGNIA